MKRRDPHQWMKTRLNDPFFVKAKQEGYRARSAYKLIEIHQKYNIIRGNVLDLGAAPGAWLQVIKRFGANVEGIDLLAIQPIHGVRTLKADIFSQETKDFIGNTVYDTILSDIAPNCTSQRELNHLLLMNIANEVLALALTHLKPGGNICIKIFDGAAFIEFLANFKKHFQKVYRFKPKASCLDNSEFYLIGCAFKQSDLS